MKSIKPIRWRVILVIFVVFGVVTAGNVWAASLDFSPSSGSAGLGDNLVVKVKINTGNQEINAASAVINFPADLLSINFISGAGVFDIWPEKVASGSAINLSGGRLLPPFTGSGDMATIGFTVLQTGTARLAFSQGSHVLTAVGNQDVFDRNFTVANFNLTKISTASGLVNGGKTALEITNLKVTPDLTSAGMAWDTNNEADSEVEYGLGSGKRLLLKSDGNLVKNHSVKLSGLVAGTSYYYIVRSIDAAGNEAESKEQSFRTTGGAAGQRTTGENTPVGLVSKLGQVTAFDWRIWVLVLLVLAVAGVGGVIFWKRRKS